MIEFLWTIFILAMVGFICIGAITIAFVTEVIIAMGKMIHKAIYPQEKDSNNRGSGN